MSPDVQLSCEPWGHVDHNGGGCECLSSDRTGAYVHGLSLTPRESLPISTLEDISFSTGGSGARMSHVSDLGVGRPGLVPFVSHNPSEAVIATQTVVDALPVGMDSGPDVLTNSPSPDVHRPFSGSSVGAVADLPNYVTRHVGHRSPGLVPFWWLVREGPFLVERSSSSLRCSGAGRSFRNTTYRPSDYALPSGEFGIPLHHPRFWEWIGVPESDGLLEMGPGR